MCVWTPCPWSPQKVTCMEAERLGAVSSAVCRNQHGYMQHESCPWPAPSHTQALPEGQPAHSAGHIWEGAEGKESCWAARAAVARVPDPSAAGRGCGAPAYQVVDLVVPPTGHKHHLACLLRDLQRRATAISRGVQAAVQEAGGGHVVGQATMTVSQGVFLPWWEEEPLLLPADVDRPAEGAENVGMERRPVQELLLVPCGSDVSSASSE